MPYQLHCCPAAELTEELTTEELEELGTEDLEDELVLTTLELTLDELVLTTLELTLDELLDVATLELDDAPPAHAAPVITGISAVAPPLVPWMPNSADCPG